MQEEKEGRMWRKTYSLLVLILFMGVTACTIQVAPTPRATASPVSILTPSPTAIPIPEALKNLPQGLIAIHNEDGTWGIGVDVGEATTA
jgi:hypothetical protein